MNACYSSRGPFLKRATLTAMTPWEARRGRSLHVCYPSRRPQKDRHSASREAMAFGAAGGERRPLNSVAV